MKKTIFTSLILLSTIVACNNAPKTEETDFVYQEPVVVPKTDSIIAIINTTKGIIICDLEFEKTPITVANFIGLSEGNIKNTFRAAGNPFFEGLTFHRVIPNFMIQGGDPDGSGMGGPGYNFKDEFDNSLKFEGPGVLAMANSGPTTNGSQFFITHAAQPHLNNKHTIFGHVLQGQDVVNAIAQGDKIVSITYKRVGATATAFDAASIFNEYQNGKSSVSQSADDFEKWVKSKYPEAKKHKDMYILVNEKGTGAKPKSGQKISAHYTGTLTDGSKFDSSVDRGTPFEFTVGMGQVIKGWDEGFMQLNAGSKAKFLIPANMAYGDNAQGPIPPKATLIFDVELLNIN